MQRPDGRLTAFEWMVIAALIGFCAAIAVCGADAHGAVGPQMKVARCEQLLHASYVEQTRRGDRPLGIHPLSNGAAQINYVNPKTGQYTEYLLIADYRGFISDGVPEVYGKCVLPPQSPAAGKMATMYRLRWLSFPRGREKPNFNPHGK